MVKFGGTTNVALFVEIYKKFWIYCLDKIKFYYRIYDILNLL